MSELERVPWSRHMDRLTWQPGEHTILIGPTGRGKTTLMRNLIKYREARQAHILIIATKSRDETMSALAPQRPIVTKRKLKNHPRGYLQVKSWNQAVRSDHDRILLWVRYRGPSSIKRQQAEARQALQQIFEEGGWTVVIDELRWFTDRMKMEDWIVDLYLQGRSLGVSALAGTQRPRHVPLEVYGNSTHLYIWATKDQEDLRRLSGLGGLDTQLIRQEVGELEGHDVLYIDTRREDLYVTRAPRPA